jgi:heterodisulfide reductase subunit B
LPPQVHSLGVKVTRTAYFPGCALRTTAKGFEESALASSRALGIELVELSRWNCCGTVHSLTSDDLIHQVAPARNLVRVQEMNEQGLLKDEFRLVVLCSLCYNTLKRTNLLLDESPEKLEKINSFMDEDGGYLQNVQVLSLLELFREMGFDRVRDRVKRPLEGLRVTPYYGCMLLRPREVAIDDSENPVIMEDLLEALGIEVVDNPYKTRCCGSYHTVYKKQTVAKLTHEFVSYATRKRANAVALACPLCAFNLDDRQREVKELYPKFEEIPVFYFTQLMAIAFGIRGYWSFDLNYVDPTRLLKGRGLLK